MEVFEAVTKRRSVRIFKEEAVDYSVLEKCVESARLSPTAMNSQLCEYFIADDKKLVSEILDSVALWGGSSQTGRRLGSREETRCLYYCPDKSRAGKGARLRQD